MGAKPYIFDSSEDEAIWNMKLIGIYIMQGLNYGATWVHASLSKHIMRLKDDWLQINSLRHLDLLFGNNAVIEKAIQLVTINRNRRLIVIVIGNWFLLYYPCSVCRCVLFLVDLDNLGHGSRSATFFTKLIDMIYSKKRN